MFKYRKISKYANIKKMFFYFRKFENIDICNQKIQNFFNDRCFVGLIRTIEARTVKNKQKIKHNKRVTYILSVAQL